MLVWHIFQKYKLRTKYTNFTWYNIILHFNLQKRQYINIILKYSSMP